VRELFALHGSGVYSIAQLHEIMIEKGLQTHRGKAPSQNVINNILTNPFYLGVVVWNDAHYPGNHDPIITPEAFERVQDVLRERTGGRTRQRVHDHYLRGSVFCLTCEARLTNAPTKGNGGSYEYFFCLGRHNGRTDCQQPYTAAHDLESQVETLWWRVQIPQWTKDMIKRDVEREVRERMNDWAPRATAAVRRLEELRKERERLLKAYLAEAVPVDLLKTEQDRIGNETRALEAETAKPQAQAE